MSTEVLDQKIFCAENVKRGRRLGYLTIVWNSLAVIIAVGIEDVVVLKKRS